MPLQCSSWVTVRVCAALPFTARACGVGDAARKSILAMIAANRGLVEDYMAGRLDAATESAPVPARP